MADSLRDQLLKSGIAKQVPKKPAPPRPPQGRRGKVPDRGNRHKPARSQEEIDLAKAYALRAQSEAKERKLAEQAAAEQARLKRERKEKVRQLLDGKALNKADAEQVRNFEYGSKIRRIYVDADQLKALNAGELGIVQQAGRFLLVSREVAEQVHAIEPALLALLPESGGQVADDGVPDDLMW